MANWTNHEVRDLKAMHDCRCPSLQDLAERFTRHTPNAIKKRAHSLGLRRPRVERVKWLRAAHQHFARRESGLLA